MSVVTKRSFPNVWRPSRQPTTRDLVRFDDVFTAEYGLVGGWIFNRTTPFDLSPYSNVPIPTATTFGLTPGQFGAHMDAPGGGGNNRLDFGSITSDNPLSLSQDNACTIVFRSRHDSNPSSFPRLFDKSNSGNASGGYAVYRDSSNQMVLQIGSPRNGKIKSTTPPSGWQSWAITRKNNSSAQNRIYLDGVDNTATQDLSTGNFATTTTNAAFFNWNHSTNRNWDGALEYFYVFDKVIPLEDIFRLYREPYRYIVPVSRSQLIFLPSGGTPPPPSGNPWYHYRQQGFM